MIALVLAAGLAANSITAPFGLWGRAEWGAARPNIRLTLENRAEVKAWLVDVVCNAYDARGQLVGVSTANLAQLQPGERQSTWAIGDPAPAARRFACKVSVSEWRRPAAKGPAKSAPKPAARPASPARTVVSPSRNAAGAGPP